MLLPQIQLFHLGACPWRTTQEAQAGCDAGFVREAAYGDSFAHGLPAQMLNEVIEHLLEGYAVQRVARLGLIHDGEGSSDPEAPPRAAARCGLLRHQTCEVGQAE